jgi:tetrahydromethanopterin S-methyltransferase subunit A
MKEFEFNDNTWFVTNTCLQLFAKSPTYAVGLRFKGSLIDSEVALFYIEALDEEMAVERARRTLRYLQPLLAVENKEPA